MRDAATASGMTLSVAENYRRDPLCRVAKALLDSGVIGEPRMVMEVSLGGGDTLMHNTAWRALKSRGGGMLIDAGVHTSDLLLYYLGDVARVYAETGLFETTRYRRAMPPTWRRSTAIAKTTCRPSRMPFRSMPSTRASAWCGSSQARSAI